MIDNIIQLLEYAKGETENIKIAQGKYRLPNNLKEGYRQLKKEVRWKK
tara:strand:- start:674 stop:817 length:144 start_codon:yes stop_codon:yes gene_type:complete